MTTLEARLSINPKRAIDMLRQDRRLRRAAKQMPKPATWDWARTRLLPLLAGPYLGSDPLVTVVGHPGCAVVFGVDIAETFVLVDRRVAERWECSDDLLASTAAANLDRRAAKLDPRSITHGTLAGRIVRILESVSWSSSLVLAPDHLTRLFGRDDQVFAVPRREMIVAFAVDTPPRVVAQIATDLEWKAAYPLLLDPFYLEGGQLIWQTAEDDGEW